MIFTPTSLAGAWVVDIERSEDRRGFFARTWCSREFEDHGLETRFVQRGLSRNPRSGTLRGMHWQIDPCAEVKLVSCSRGTIWDVIVDLRPDSATYLRHFAVELDGGSRRALYVPAGFAHGFVTMVEDSDVEYQMSQFHTPEAARGARWNDPAFGIEWPVRDPFMNDRDATYPDFVPEALC